MRDAQQNRNKKTKLAYIGLSILTLMVCVFLLLSNGYDRVAILAGLHPENPTNIDSLSATTIRAIEGTKDKTTLYAYFNKDTQKKPVVSAEAYLVGDLLTGDIIIQKNENKKFPIASVSKLMTATVANESNQKEELITVSKQALATEGQNGDFRLNEKVKSGHILYPLLIESSNDAAEAIAMHKGRVNFIEQMNVVAQKIGLSDTSFADPSGLSEKNISTSRDLFLLSKYIFEKDRDILDISKKKSFSNGPHVWLSNNQFLKQDGYLGGKSGYIDESRQTVVSLFSLPLSPKEDRTISITLLRSNDRKKDIQNILNYLKSNIVYGTIVEAKEGWVTDKLGTVEHKDPDFVNLTFLGDMMLDRGVKNSVNKNFAGDYSKLFENLDLGKNSDIVFANLEGTASDKGKDVGSIYSFRMNPSVIPAIKGAGINIVSMANNHSGDWGIASYVDTLKRLKENEVLYTGGGFNLAEASQPVIVETHGIKIGYLGFSDVGPNWLKATEENAGILLASNPNFDQIISNAAAKVDHLVVSFHFGDEYKKIHNARQESLAHRAVDAGAKLVIGHHPHVMQDTEVYKNGFIAYSLGNFIFDQYFSADTMEGMMLEVKLGKDGSMTTKKNVVKLNRVFQPEQVIPGKAEPVKFQEIQKIETKI